MFRILFSLTVVWVSSTVATAEKNPICPAEAALAAKIMWARQQGAPRAELEEYADRGDWIARPIAKIMVRLAYQRPVARTAAGRKREIRNFAGGIRNDCIREDWGK